MAHAAIWKVTANGTTTSPILRGKWVLEKFVGKPPSPPPPTSRRWSLTSAARRPSASSSINTATRLLIDATGADVKFADREVIEQIIRDARAKDCGLRTLLHAVVQSRSLLNK